MPAEPSPNCSTRRVGFASATRSTAATTGSTRSWAVSALPFIENSTTAERPSLLIWPPFPGANGLRTSWTRFVAVTASITSAAALRPPLVRMLSRPRAWSSTSSGAWRWKPRSNKRYALAESPADSPDCDSSRSPVLAATIATSTSASQAKIALKRCSMLQRPSCPASPVVPRVVNIAGPPW